MLIMLQQLLNDHVLDGKNPYKCYDLAKEYDRLEQGAMAVSLYLKAADLSSDPELQYKCMIGIARCYERKENRGYTVEGALLDAAALLPMRPEALYHLCKHYELKTEWKRCFFFANLALESEEDMGENCELGYPGWIHLKYYQALSKWYITGQQDAKELLFDLKYKYKLKDSLKDKVDRMIKTTYFPTAIPYVSNDIERFKFPFHGIETIPKNNSKHFQDMFVLSALEGKTGGTYLEIGSGDPFEHSNTALLEKFGWKGISIDLSEALCCKFKENRINTVICADAMQINYEDLFSKHCVDNVIDYLQIDCDDASMSVLNKIPFDRYKFRIITFEHDSYRLGTAKKTAAKELLLKHGYVIAVPDVKITPDHPYEDWYIHPDLIDLPKEMKKVKESNFVWDYFMEEL